jgi:hypothetical protein
MLKAGMGIETQGEKKRTEMMGNREAKSSRLTQQMY